MAFSPDQGQTHDSSHLQALPTTKATIARVKIAEIGTATPRSRYVGKKAGAGLGGWKKFIEGNIGLGDWKLLKKMKIKERQKDEAVAFRAKAKTKRVTGIRSSAGGTGSASGAAQGTSVRSTQIVTTF